jgi:hypothetical protein
MTSPSGFESRMISSPRVTPDLPDGHGNLINELPLVDEADEPA